jgi:hypothetical protein
LTPAMDGVDGGARTQDSSMPSDGSSLDGSSLDAGPDADAGADSSPSDAAQKGATTGD